MSRGSLATLTDVQLNRLAPEQAQDLKRSLPSNGAAPVRAQRVRGPLAGVPVVAEGDSWFSFPPGIDILDHLEARHGIALHKFARAGDTLGNMILGPVGSGAGLFAVLRALRDVRPRFLLFSGGGNDVVGANLPTFLNHAGTGLPPLRAEVARYFIGTVFRTMLLKMIDETSAALPAQAPPLQIVMHGYAPPYATGRGVGIFGFNFVGPWLKPAFDAAAIPEDQRRPVLIALVDLFNDMLADVQRERPNFHALRLYGGGPHDAGIRAADWRDELHLTNARYRAVAAVFAGAMTRLLPSARTQRVRR